MAHYAWLTFFIVVNFVTQLDRVGVALIFNVRVAENYI